MKLHTTILPVGALVMTLGFGGLSAAAAQRDRSGRDRNGRESQGQARQRQGSNESAGTARQGSSRSAATAPAAPERSRDSATREQSRDNARADSGQDRGARGAEAPRNDARRDDGPGLRRDDGPTRNRAVPRGAAPRYEAPRYEDPRADRRNDVRERNERREAFRYPPYRNDGYRVYSSPRYIPGGRRHYYGTGGRYSVYFGLGSGYLYDAPWSGRVYGYVGPSVYGRSVYYGDVRLQVRPRDAEVYVDGYYAGIVDDFDGVFQRLTLEVGPHQIEIAAPGLEPQFFDVYVDARRTVDIRSDLYR